MRNTSGSGCASVGTCRPTTWYWWYCAGRTRVIASCQSPTSLSPRRSSSPRPRLARVHHRTNHRERVACISLFHLGPSPPLPSPRPPSRARPRAPTAIEPKPQTARSGRPVRRRLRVHRIEPPPRLRARRRRRRRRRRTHPQLRHDAVRGASRRGGRRRARREFHRPDGRVLGPETQMVRV